jgi:predicted phage terminase large subunit-like protein
MAYVPLIKFGQAVAPEIGETFLPLPHVQTICTELELVFAGVTQYLMILIPPRHGKTLPTSQLFPAWCYGMSPASKFILASYGIDLANDNSDMVRRIMRTDAYQKIFPGIGIGDKNKQGDWNTTGHGRMASVGRDGAITGRGAGGLNGYFEGAIVLDDLIKASEARSASVRETSKNFIVGTIENRRNSSWTPIILIMQRLHPSDPAGWILKNNFMGPWKVVQLKAIGDDGKALWPERKSVKQWMNLKKVDPFTYHAQGQQAPTMPGGNLCQSDWWHEWGEEDLKNVVAGFITVDSSFGKTSKSDFTIVQLWLHSSQGLLLYDQIRGRWKSPEIKKQITRFWEHYKPVNITDIPIGPVYIEDAASGTSVAQDLELSSIPVELWPTRGVPKVLRFKDSLIGIESGRTMIPPEDYEAGRPALYPGEVLKFVPLFKEEHSEFTEDESHDFDDQCDGQSMADKIYRDSYGGIGNNVKKAA